MGVTTRDSLFAAVLAGSIWFALRPDPRVDSAVDVAMIPTRVLAETAAPLRWWRARSVSAAHEELELREEREYAERRGLFEAERAAALPRTPALAEGRRFVHAEVIGRRPRRFDELELRIDGESCEGLARGMPVTVGDVFVGRVLEIDVPREGRAIVELVTSSTFAIGARVDESEARAVVGGLVATRGAPRERMLLSLSHPSERGLPDGKLVRVDESLSRLARFAAESNGFSLGALRRLDATQWGVEPLLDYAAGLSQLVIVAPADVERAAENLGADELSDGGWTRARVLTSGEPSPGRDGCEISAGRWRGAAPGAALVVGARLIGRVLHAGLLSSDAQRISDPGFSVQALARIDGRDEPWVLGRIVSLGRCDDEEGDAVEFTWDAVVPIPAENGESSVHAVLFTGSGEALVPRGLLLGEAQLSTREGPQSARLRLGLEVSALGELWLRTPREVDEP